MVRSLLVVNYPTISAFEFAWIQNVRKQHDELYLQVINPHFTLVFPAFNFLEAPFINHVQQVTQKTQAFDFVIRCAVLSNDVFSQYTHVFLVPDEGYSNIVKLHDRLYTGVLTKELRQDIPFIPHIGIANSRNPQECKRVVDELNAQSFEITGRVEKLDVIWYENNRVGTIEKITLV
ncbi:MAG: 2'-5' RNA ligase family protein [Nostoc sp.]|uniref:2'-5' RNA ligase family protein n=1 Tax=Nostoc sp. TaxID=1180 RepID=UPI002FF4D987